MNNMTNLPSRFHLADDHAAEAVLAELSNHFPLQEELATERRTLYLDSFDWRIYARGLVLKLETEGAMRRLLLSDLKGVGNQVSMAIGSETPKFAWDLSLGRIREQLTPLLEMRALLPQVEIKSSIRTLRLLDDEEKTVLKLVFEESESRPPGKGSLEQLMPRLHLLPVRGYPKPLQRLEQHISEKLDLQRIANGALDEALAAIGRRPADYSSKLNFKFYPEMKAVEAAKQIHLHLLDILETNLPGTRADIDSEYLHDLRVAVRRTRSALTQIKKVFSEEAMERFKDRLAWIGQITGPTRDMDVYLLGFDDYLQSLPEQFRSDLEPLHDFLRSHQQIAHQEMVKKLNSPHMHKLLKEWRKFLQEPTSV
ncbi:MAG: CHAD domain-containing protein, partial [Gammaproteobacteria bacterium]|nr:CHAD domain-containing protein [Gammaproteobacteria bacterium]